MIDTKALRSLDTDSNLGLSIPMSHEAICAIADELDRLYHDASPLSREELETVLKDAGWTKSKYISLYSHEKHTGEIKISDAILWFGQYCIPLSAVTRRLLRDCGVIE